MYAQQNLTIGLTAMTYFDHKNRQHLIFYVTDDTDITCSLLPVRV